MSMALTVPSFDECYSTPLCSTPLHSTPGCHVEVHVDRAGLGAVLRRVVRVTAGRPVRSLETLHAALSGVVARFALTADRRDLVQVRVSCQLSARCQTCTEKKIVNLR